MAGDQSTDTIYGLLPYIKIIIQKYHNYNYLAIIQVLNISQEMEPFTESNSDHLDSHMASAHQT